MIFDPEIHAFALATRTDNFAHDEKVVVVDYTVLVPATTHDSACIKWTLEILEDDAIDLNEVELRETEGEPWLALVVNENGDWNNRLGVTVKAS